MHPCRLDAVDGTDGAGKFALEGAQGIDVLDEGRGAERVGFVEDLVTDAAALGQASFGELHAQPRDLVLRHHDDGAVVADFEGNCLAFEVLDDGRRVLEAEVGKEGGHLRGGDAHDHEREEADQRGCHRDHRRQSRSTQPPQEAYETLQTHCPSDSAPGNRRSFDSDIHNPPERDANVESDHWAIIAYGMVSIWLTKVKGRQQGGETEKIDFAGRSRFCSIACLSATSVYWRYCWMRVVRRPARPC